MSIQRSTTHTVTVRPALPLAASAVTADKTHTVQRGTEPAATVQRQLEVPSLGDAATAAVNAVLPALPTPAVPAAVPAPPKLDTDELARQVYAELKRKLAVERERLRLV